MKTFDELWKDLEENFNWDKVHKTMVFLEWKWRDIGVPDIDDLKASAKELCQRVFNTNTVNATSSSGTGGLYAEYMMFKDQNEPWNELTLTFTLESFSVW